MKSHHSNQLNSSSRNSIRIFEGATQIRSVWRRRKLPLYLFMTLCFNLVVAPVVYSANNNELSRTQAWAIGVLGLATLALSIYLFFVMFVPEKF
ncbi:potassium-transporting ATPase subunit F [Pseudanabaena sp. PCC 6802]|uniref:potassium-transporting ATPase subunit F n=1 Tax=Pseudanabaena sp. PCC 6802 TaxID=118173 RepID=UPI0009FF919F